MGDESAVAELTLDQQMDKDLEALRPKAVEASALPVVPPAVPAAEVPPVVPAAAAPVEETLEAKLAKIEEAPVAPKAETPALNSEQQKILSLVPNSQVAEQVTQLASGYQNFTGAFERGDFDGVEQMLTAWKPEAYAAFEEHIYQKKVASGEWIDRWADEKEGKLPHHPAMKTMQREIAQLRDNLKAQETTKSTQAQQQYNDHVARQYVSHIDGLFEKIAFSAADRPLVREIIDRRVSASIAVRQAIHSGNTAAVNAIFKQAVNDYVKRDQAMPKSQATDPNGVRKPLVQGGAVAQEGTVTDEAINAAKGSTRTALLDRKLDDDLAALASRSRR